MRLGASLAHLSPQPPRAVAQWASRLAGSGFESLWVPQLIGRGSLVLDPFVTLAVAATATSDVELGTATLQLPLYHPADLAHRILSLRAVCGDRLSLGVSPGSTAADAAAYDRDHTSRFRTFDRNLERLRVLLAHGADDHADLAPADLAGLPPLLLGSWGAKVERAAREFDGWLVSAHRRTPEQILDSLEHFRAAGGRRAIVCTLLLADRSDLGPTGELLHRFSEAGFDDAVVLIEPGGPDPEQVRALLP